MHVAFAPLSRSAYPRPCPLLLSAPHPTGTLAPAAAARCCSRPPRDPLRCLGDPSCCVPPPNQLVFAGKAPVVGIDPSSPPPSGALADVSDHPATNRPHRKLRLAFLYFLLEPCVLGCTEPPELKKYKSANNKSENHKLEKHKSATYKLKKYKSEFYKSVSQLMSSKSSQVNNLALGSYSGVRFFLQVTQIKVWKWCS